MSFSEISTAMTCFAQWDFRYGGRLAGDSLRAKLVAPVLSDGRAWGAAVAAWHASEAPFDLFLERSAMLARWQAHEAMIASFAQSATFDFGRLAEHQERLGLILDHYMATAEKLPNLTRLEGELDVALPSRRGVHSSNRYRFRGFLDGFTVDEHGNEWLVEFKLRRQLQRAAQIQLSRQVRWYAWARMRESDRPVVGVLVDERLNEAPRPARIVKGRKGQPAPSHAVDQLTTPESYRALCRELGDEPHENVVEALKAREWQKRTPIIFRPGELEEAAEELVTAAKLIRELDAGDLFPIRNASPMHCNGCEFREICAAPDDVFYVDSLFERVLPKRLRSRERADIATITAGAGPITHGIPAVGPLNPFTAAAPQGIFS